MHMNLAQKIISGHLSSGTLEPGSDVGIEIDQTLIHDATGVMAFLQLEAIGVGKVQTKASVAYVDHNCLQVGFENADDHRFLQDMAARYGAWFSGPGNGVCHQVHLERFSIPGQTLVGADSHTSTMGGLGMLAIGVGGLDAAVAMAGGGYHFTMPKVINVRLKGSLKPWVGAKDVILDLLRVLTVKGGLGRILEYSGPGVSSLSVPERATIANMGAETGATTSIFPSDNKTFEFMSAQGRAGQWLPICADENAVYEKVIEVDLSQLVPLVACPHSPDNVKTVAEMAGFSVDQVVIGSCTNSSYQDLRKIANVLKGKNAHSGVSFVVSPGSRQVVNMLAKDGSLADLITAGARVLEPACGPCIGVGQSPPSKGISLRTVNRNFLGRSGTLDAQVFLASPETAAASVLTGVLTDPQRLFQKTLSIPMPERFELCDTLLVGPGEPVREVKVRRGPNIQELPRRGPLSDVLRGPALLKLGDNITTDHIMPAGANILKFRSNIPAISKFAFADVDPEFPARALASHGGWIVAGENYGQGSSREHAALVPMYLGVFAVLAKSIARIHKDNLINFGILPVLFKDPTDYDTIEKNDLLMLEGIGKILAQKKETVTLVNSTKNLVYTTQLILTSRQRECILAGGKLNVVH